MKSAVKFCSIMLVVGLLLSGIGFALGGRPLSDRPWRGGWYYLNRIVPFSMRQHMGMYFMDVKTDHDDGGCWEFPCYTASPVLTES